MESCTVLSPFKKELKHIIKLINGENNQRSQFLSNFKRKDVNNSSPSQSFNFWRVGVSSHNLFSSIKNRPTICIAVLDSCRSLVDMDAVLIMLFYYFPRCQFVILEINNFFDIYLAKKRISKEGVVQFEAYSTCRLLRRLRARKFVAIIGVTQNELYYDDARFVLGQAFFNLGAAVICLGKGMLTSIEDRGTITERLIKSVLHETAHLFGIQHCVLFDCLMNESTSLEEACRQPFQLCPMCLTKLQFLLDFKVDLRYSCIKDYLDIVGPSNGGRLDEFLNFLRTVLTS